MKIARCSSRFDDTTNKELGIIIRKKKKEEKKNCSLTHLPEVCYRPLERVTEQTIA